LGRRAERHAALDDRADGILRRSAPAVADLHIALAAFNMGYGAMLRSIARYNTNDYYRLCEYENGIPWETCLYTPKILAAAIVGHNRAAFGFDKLTPAAAEAWDEIGRA